MTVIMRGMAALPQPAGSTRERLLAAAVDVFVEQGYERARVQDIARAAGLTTGAIYANFRGKSELLFDAIGARAHAELDTLLAEAHTREPRELLELLGDRLFQPRTGAPLLIDAIAAARRDGELASALRERLDSRERILAELAARAQAEGTMDSDIDAGVFGRFGLTLALGSLVLRTLQVAPPDGDEWHDLISRLLDAISQEKTDDDD
jgi:AcrR family transcriptional regulator